MFHKDLVLQHRINSALLCCNLSFSLLSSSLATFPVDPQQRGHNFSRLKPHFPVSEFRWTSCCKVAEAANEIVEREVGGPYAVFSTARLTKRNFTVCSFPAACQGSRCCAMSSPPRNILPLSFYYPRVPLNSPILRRDILIAVNTVRALSSPWASHLRVCSFEYGIALNLIRRLGR